MTESNSIDTGEPERASAAAERLDGREGAGNSSRSNGESSRANGAAEIDQLQAALAEAQQQTLRACAELDNFRKRARRELEDERRYASVPLLRELLPVLDNVSRAIDAAERTPDSASLLEGFKLVRQQFADVLQRHNCLEIPALYEPFDPSRHAAICTQPSAEYPENTVLAVVQPGYQVHDRVVRPSQVIVSKAPAAER